MQSFGTGFQVQIERETGAKLLLYYPVYTTNLSNYKTSKSLHSKISENLFKHRKTQQLNKMTIVNHFTETKDMLLGHAHKHS